MVNQDKNSFMGGKLIIYVIITDYLFLFQMTSGLKFSIIMSEISGKRGKGDALYSRTMMSGKEDTSAG